MTHSFGEAALRLATLGAQHLGWLPDTFWRSTPAELATALADPGRTDRAAALSRTEFEQLMEQENDG